jgi:MFS family permease
MANESESVVERVEEVQSGPWAEIASVRYAAPAAMFTLGITLHAFNAFIASTTMPSAAIELGAVSLLSWATSSYLVASIVGGAAAAVFKARFGARVVLLASSVVFLAGTLAFGFANSIAPIILGRILQGAGEGVVMACCYTLIPEIFPKSLVPRIFALESVAWVTAALGGPLIAGAITEAVSWRAAVLVSVPAALAFMVLVPICVPAAGGGNGSRIRMPLPQLMLVGLGVFLLSAHIPVVGAFGSVGGGLALLVAAVWLDRRSALKLFPAGAFDWAHPVGAGMLLVLVMALAEAPAVVYTAFVGQRLWLLGATASGVLAAIVAISWSLMAIAIAHVPRMATRAYILPAPLILAAGLALQALAFSLESIVVLIIGQVLIGASFGFSWARLCEHVMETAPIAERDFAAAALPTIQVAGVSIGAALAGTVGVAMGIETAQAPAAIAAALVPVFAGGALIALGGLFVARRAV